MKKNVIAIFDIGKTNKKLILFDEALNIVSQTETVFPEIRDDDGFECDDVDNLISWMQKSFKELTESEEYEVIALNFSTYGATLAFLDEAGNKTAPVYNYLKEMPKGLLEEFYKKYGGVEEFSRKTASPALCMLNSGLQIFWLKNKKPDYWHKTKYILHFPQYVSYIFTGEIASEYTSIGCHTALWDFDAMTYHKWLTDEAITLPQPVSNATTFDTEINGKTIKTGIGIHDSSASLVPYLKANQGKEFILVSSGTWAINMNPFSSDKLTIEELRKDSLCFLSIDQKQVKASRLFLGHIHEVNAVKISEHFKVDATEFRNVKADNILLKQMISENRFVFFPEGIPADYKADLSKLDSFADFNTAYHQLMFELSVFEADAIRLATDKNDTTESIYITGGFVKNKLFTSLLATFFPGKEVFAADIYNATALGAAMVVIPTKNIGNIEVKLEKCLPV